MSKVCHLTSVHPPFDIRIFYKQCSSLVHAGYEVSLVAPIAKSTINNNVSVISASFPKLRIKRMLVVTFRMLRMALKQKARLYQFHDPELLFCGIFLKLCGKKVIFDVHENVRLSFKSKSWLPQLLVPFFTFLYYFVERFAILFFDALVLAEDSYLKYYPESKSTVVLNYPILKQDGVINKEIKKPLRFIYVGGVSENRGIWEMIKLIQYLNENEIVSELTVVGQIYSESLRNDINEYIQNNRIQSSVRIIGKVDFTEIESYLKNSDIGLALLKPIANYKESLPTKIFEYMQNGLPVISNDFALYKKYVEDNKVGICVDIENIDIEKIKAFAKDESLLIEMGQNGREVVHEKYNWKSEEAKLINLYKKILN